MITASCHLFLLHYHGRQFSDRAVQVLIGEGAGLCVALRLGGIISTATAAKVRNSESHQGTRSTLRCLLEIHLLAGHAYVLLILRCSLGSFHLMLLLLLFILSLLAALYLFHSRLDLLAKSNSWAILFTTTLIRLLTSTLHGLLSGSTG